MTEASPIAPARTAAFIFVFITVLLDMLALGIIIPVLPKPRGRFRRRRCGARRRLSRPVRHRLGADAVRVLAGARRAVRSLRPPARHPAVEFRAWPRLHPDGAGADAVVAVRRPHHLRHLRSQHFDVLRLHRRRDAGRDSALRGSACSASRSAPASWSGPRSAGLRAAVDPRLPFWIAAALSLAQWPLWRVRSCRSRCRRTGARRSPGGAPIRSAHWCCCARIRNCSGLAMVELPRQSRACEPAEHRRALHDVPLRLR